MEYCADRAERPAGREEGRPPLVRLAVLRYASGPYRTSVHHAGTYALPVLVIEKHISIFEVVAAPAPAPADRGGLASGSNGGASYSPRGGSAHGGARTRRPKRPRHQEGRPR